MKNRSSRMRKYKIIFSIICLLGALSYINDHKKKHQRCSTSFYRSSRWGEGGRGRGVFCKKGVLKNFAKFTGKHLCQSLFFNKVSGLRPETLLKERLSRRCFPMNFAKFLRTPFLIEHLQSLLLLLNTSLNIAQYSSYTVNKQIKIFWCSSTFT